MLCVEAVSDAVAVFLSAEQAEQWEVGDIFPVTELFSFCFKEALSVQVFVNGGMAATTVAKTHKTTAKQENEEEGGGNNRCGATTNIATRTGVPDLLRNVGEFPETFL